MLRVLHVQDADRSIDFEVIHETLGLKLSLIQGREEDNIAFINTERYSSFSHSVRFIPMSLPMHYEVIPQISMPYSALFLM